MIVSIELLRVRGSLQSEWSEYIDSIHRAIDLFDGEILFSCGAKSRQRACWHFEFDGDFNELRSHLIELRKRLRYVQSSIILSEVISEYI